MELTTTSAACVHDHERPSSVDDHLHEEVARVATPSLGVAPGPTIAARGAHALAWWASGEKGEALVAAPLSPAFKNAWQCGSKVSLDAQRFRVVEESDIEPVLMKLRHDFEPEPGLAVADIAGSTVREETYASRCYQVSTRMDARREATQQARVARKTRRASCAGELQSAEREGCPPPRG